MSLHDALSGGAKSIAGNAYRAFRREYARRLDEGGSVAEARLHKEIDEALDVLAQDGATAVGALQAVVKAWISRPSTFSHPHAAQWVATELVRTAVKNAVLADIRGEVITPFAESAMAFYDRFPELADDMSPDANEAWGNAFAYVIRSLERDLTFGDKVLLEKLNGLSAKFDRSRQRPGGGAIDDRYILDSIDRLRRRRFFASATTMTDAGNLAAQVLQLDDASRLVRARALAWCARWVSTENPSEARRLLSDAREISAGLFVEADVAEAFIARHDEGQGALARIDVDASPLHCTAALQFLRFDRDDSEALVLADRAGVRFESLDSDGRYVLIAMQVSADRWEDAIQSVRALADSDYEKTPALLWIAATVLIAAIVPPDLRPPIMGGVPVHPSRFPLPEDTPAIDDRRVAADLLEEVARQCDSLDLPKEAENARRFQLWLNLRDKERRLSAIDSLKERVRNPATAVGYLPLALDFEVGIKMEDAEKELDRYLARRPDGDTDWALARFTLILARADADDMPVEALRLLQKHRALLSRYLDGNGLLALEIQFLVNAGRESEARALLSASEGEQLPDRLRSRVLASLSGDEAQNLEDLEAMYRATPTFVLLGELVTRYQKEGFSQAYLDHACEFLRQSRGAGHARMITDFLLREGQHQAAFGLLTENWPLTQATPDLLARYAWLAFEDGKLVEAEDALARVEADRDEASERQLRYHLLVATGRWPELDAFLEREWARRDQRDAQEIGGLAQLAGQLGSPRTRELIELAVERGPDDPKVLVAAYNAATSAGLEESISSAGHWIMRAAELSDEDGPVHQASLEVLVSGHGAWEDQVEEAWRLLANAAIPLQGAAMMLRRPWLGLHVVAALANESEREPRNRSIIPLFGGKRGPFEEPVDLPIAAVALDRTAIMTLAALDLLDPVLSACDEIHISHDTLSDLFDQRQRLVFHQPSKISFAHQLTGLLGNGAAKPFVATTPPDPVLAADIGNTLADLIQEAAGHSDGQHLVVHPYPITRAGTFLRDPVDLSAYRAQLMSCNGVVDFLDRDGRLTRQEAEKARSYLTDRDQPWPNEPEIHAGSTLYLSDLAVDYLRYVGLLTKLVNAGITVIISPSEISEARALLEHEQMSEKVGAIIEATRRSLAAGIAAGRIHLDQQSQDEDEHRSFLASAHLAQRAPVLVCDDRLLNQYDRFDLPDGQSRILTSLQLCEALAVSGRLNSNLTRDLRTRLRRMGAMCVPLDADELVAMIQAAEVTSAGLRERGELRALRENVLLMRLRGWFHPLVDALWLLKFENALTEAIVAQWASEDDDEIAGRRSRWLLDLLDLRDWADIVDRKRFQGLVVEGAVLMIGKLATACFSLATEPKERFSTWLEEEVAKPLWYSEPRLRGRTLEHLRATVLSLDEDVSQGVDSEIPRDVRLSLALSNFPTFLQIAMAEDEKFRRTLNLKIKGLVTLGSGVADFDRDDFFATIEKVYADPAAALTLEDTSGRSWQAGTIEAEGDWPIKLEHGEMRHLLRGVYARHPSEDARLHGFDLSAEQAGLPDAERDAWRTRLRVGPLDELDIDALAADLADTPRSMVERLEYSLKQNDAPMSLLVPSSARYYRRLIHDDASLTVADYTREVVQKVVAEHVRESGLKGARDALLLGSHPFFAAASGLAALSSDMLEELGNWVVRDGDLLAKVSFIEATLDKATAGSPLETILIALISDIEALPGDDDDTGRLHYFSALFLLVYGELSRNQALAGWPPFRRRIAALAQAALIERHTFARIERGGFADAVIQDRGWHFLVQGLVDLRQEPRWRPDYASASQFKNEFIGRIINRAGALDPNALTEKLRQLIVSDNPGCLAPSRHFPQMNWPGPIEGAITEARGIMPSQMLLKIEEWLERETIEIKDLYGLINANELFKLPSDVPDRIVERIRQSGPRLFRDIVSENSQHELAGLAYVAASNRQVELADQVRNLARRRRHTPGADVSIENELHLALVASAAHEQPDAWRDALGGWLFELAIKASGDTATRLADWIDRLCEIDPELRSVTGRSRAALSFA